MITIAEHLADWRLGLRRQDISAAVLSQLEWHTLDTLGVLLGGTELPYARALMARAIAEEGAAEATLFGAGRKTPVRSAVFVNGCLGHGIDWDDTHLDALLHPTATILPVVLAIAEASNLGGGDVLDALAVGTEAMVRIGLAAGGGLVRRGLHPTSMCGTFGVALATAHMFDLNRAQTVNALGIAGGMCAGLHESVIDGSMNKCIHSGVAAQAGYAATELARVGFSGPPTIFEGPKGFLNAYVGAGGYDADAITSGLGSDWRISQLAYKTYACCQGAHPSADLALALYHEHGVRAADVEAITVDVGQNVGRALCEPAELKRRPPTPYAAKFSIPFVIASALSEGRVVLDTFSDATIADPQRLALAAKVRHMPDAYYDVGTALRGRITVTLKDSREITVVTDACSGTPQNPWPKEGVIAKFRLLAEPVVGLEAADGLVALTSRLRELPSIAPLCALVAARS